LTEKNYLSFYKSIAHFDGIETDDFFSNDIVKKAKNFFTKDYEFFKRQISNEEKQVIRQDAFDLMLFWVNDEELSIDFFERFLAILVSFSNEITNPIDKDSLSGMIEMISIIDFKDHAIYTTIEIFINHPFLMKGHINVVH